MRALEFLFEDPKTAKIKRGLYIRDTVGRNWNGVPGYPELDKFIKAIHKADPTPQGMYMPWLARLIVKNPEENKPEDLPRVKKDLVNFEKFKAKLDKKDVNQYKTFYQLFQAIEPFAGKKTKSDVEKKKKEAVRDDVETVYSGEEGWIRIPKTVPAAQYLGQNTRWCTAGKSGNMFDHYNKSDKLFVIYDAATKTRTQVHIDSNQHADVTDKNIGLDTIPDWAKKKMAAWYQSNSPELSLVQAIRMYSWSDELGSFGPHKELISLFKKYGL